MKWGLLLSALLWAIIILAWLGLSGCAIVLWSDNATVEQSTDMLSLEMKNEQEKKDATDK